MEVADAMETSEALADRDRWRREYWSEKQKNALLRSDLRAARVRIKELEAELKHLKREHHYLVTGEDHAR